MTENQGIDTPKRPRGPNLRKRERTRNKLIDAAVTLLLSKPADEITIQEITVTAEVALGTFYNYFISKTAMMNAVADKLIGDAVSRVIVDIDEVNVSEPSARLRIGFDLLRDHITNDPNLGFLMLEAGLPLHNFIAGVEVLIDRTIGELHLDAAQSNLVSGAAANLLIKHYTGHLKGSSAEMLISVVSTLSRRVAVAS
ncbi:TetR/AcrR family transcriptional regulator [Umboniibacter marinipuniceus]|uniref:TetR family transcriptional regulator n=1 Tax=Umboniibacter marinipuniceus TaxID=569599 RepID=A0A3M0AQQ4_9GAMM|nr:TetR/AcrR family transcriptional regulator [Umboniibacter marinipuniceus]RMA81332.1 TetR family transcriptional regulator [Umboniibacter marinipuniceus]